ncbi:MAG: fibronectin type III domain-containing protein [Flavobacteriaceae bacterium]|nr:fibronectin type III domain-containing protein [Flavobacteriaceae bacterium]
MFKNNGYSEIYHFEYNKDCKPPRFALASPESSGRVKVQWQGDIDHQRYMVQYRKSGVEDAEWFSVKTRNSQAQIGNLQPGTSYEFRVGGSCDAITALNPGYTYTAIHEFGMPSKEEAKTYSCGIVPEIEISNTDPLENLGVNEVFTAGDFPVTVKIIEGEQGNYSGKGYIVVPYLADTKIAVEFKNIRINTDYQLVEGKITTTYDATWGGVEDVSKPFMGGDGKSQQKMVNFPIDRIEKGPNGNILVIGKGGAPVVEYPAGEDMTITDGGEPSADPPVKPKVWTVDENGNIHEGDAAAEGGATTPSNTEGVNNKGEAQSISARDVVVYFKEAKGRYATTYGFDGYSAKAKTTKSIYQSLKQNYQIPYIAVPKDGESYIEAVLQIVSDSIQAQDIVFKTKEGIALAKVDSTAKSYTLKLEGVFEDAAIESQALIKQGESYKVAGAFIQYQARVKQLKVVVVDATTQLKVKPIKAKLQSTFDKAMVGVEVTHWANYKSKLDGLITTTTIASGESGFGAQYTADQRLVNQLIKKDPRYDSSAYYIIFTDKKPSTVGEHGLMPIGRQFGYVYDKSAHTAAHELGHGAFQLRHPFSNASYGFSKGSTNWLMDTNGGTHIPYVHWIKMHNPDLRLGIFDADGEGESAVVRNKLSKRFVLENKEGKSYLSFLTPNGEKIYLPYEKIIKPVFYFGMVDDRYEHVLPGSLIGFTYLEKGKEIKYRAAINYMSFLGYKSEEDTYQAKEPEGELIKDGVIIGFPTSVYGDKGFYVGLFSREFGTYTGSSLEKISAVWEFDFYPNIGNDHLITHKYYSDETLYSEEQDKLSALYKKTIGKHSFHEENLVVLKIAEWRNRYEKRFEEFTETFDAWTTANIGEIEHKDELADISYGTSNMGYWNVEMGKDQFALYKLWKESPLDFYKQFLQELTKFLQEKSIQNRACVDSLKKEDDVEKILLCIENLSDDEITRFDFDTRMRLLKILLDQTWVEGRSENIVVKLVSHLPPTFEYDRFLEETTINCTKTVVQDKNGNYRYTNFCLWEKIFESVDDSALFFSGDNRSRLLRALIQLYYKSDFFIKAMREYQTLLELQSEDAIEILNQKTFQYNYKGPVSRLFHHLEELAHLKKGPSYVTIDTEVVDGQWIRVQRLRVSGTLQSSEDPPIDFHPFEMVLFTNNSEQKLIGNYKTTPVPVIVLHYASTVGDIETRNEIIQTAIDAAAFLPGGQLLHFGKIGRFFYYADRISSVSSIAASGFAKDPALQDIFNKISLASGVISGATIVGEKRLIKLLDPQAIKRAEQDQLKRIKDYTNSIDNLIESDYIHMLSQKRKEELVGILESEKKAIGTLADEAGVSLVLNKMRKLLSTTVDVTKRSYKNVSYKEFVSTIHHADKVAEEVLGEAHRLWGEEKWDALYDLFNPKNADKINGGWPPYNGFRKKPISLSGIEIKDAYSNLIFDRFQTLDYQGVPQPNLNGGFASPVRVNNYEIEMPFTFNSRALMDEITEGTYYIRFQLKNTEGLIFQKGKAIPWYTKDGKFVEGGAEQIQTNIRFNELDPKDYLILQKSVRKGTKWDHLIDDFSKQLDRFKFCNK